MTIRHALLALLAGEAKHGFQLANDFEAGTGEMWPLNTGQVYTTLQRLERDELIESDDESADGSQRVYRLTATGNDELAQWLRTPPDLSIPPRDELVIKLLVALRVPGVDPVELGQIHRKHLIDTMRHYTRLKEDADEHDIGLLLVADAELFRLEAMVRWLDAAESRDRQVVRPTPAGTSSVAGAAPDTSPDRSGAMSVLVVAGVSKRYGEGEATVHALRSVDLVVEAGELVAIMGPSGSGKSTLLTIAGTLEEPTDGEVTIDGQPILEMSPNDRARLRRRSVGYVFQDFNLLTG